MKIYKIKFLSYEIYPFYTKNQIKLQNKKFSFICEKNFLIYKIINTIKKLKKRKKNIAVKFDKIKKKKHFNVPLKWLNTYKSLKKKAFNIHYNYIKITLN